jgi:hypothetical protein
VRKEADQVTDGALRYRANACRRSAWLEIVRRKIGDPSQSRKPKNKPIVRASMSATTGVSGNLRKKRARSLVPI